MKAKLVNEEEFKQPGIGNIFKKLNIGWERPFIKGDKIKVRQNLFFNMRTKEYTTKPNDNYRFSKGDILFFNLIGNQYKRPIFAKGSYFVRLPWVLENTKLFTRI